MKLVIENELTNFKTLEYEESSLTGKISITYDGTPMTKVRRKEYEFEDENGSHTAYIKGNIYSGTTLTMLDKEIILSPKMAWYEIIIIVLGLIPCLFFGAVGGLIGGIGAVVNIMVARKINSPVLKIILMLVIAVVFAYLAMMIAVAIAYAI